MNRPRYLKWAILLAAASLCVSAIAARAQPAAAPQKSPPIDEIECRTLLRQAGEDITYILLHFRGSAIGKFGQTSLPAQGLAKATDRVLDRRIVKPGATLLAASARARDKCAVSVPYCDRPLNPVSGSSLG